MDQDQCGQKTKRHTSRIHPCGLAPEQVEPVQRHHRRGNQRDIAPEHLPRDQRDKQHRRGTCQRAGHT